MDTTATTWDTDEYEQKLMLKREPLTWQCYAQII